MFGLFLYIYLQSIVKIYTFIENLESKVIDLFVTLSCITAIVSPDY